MKQDLGAKELKVVSIAPVTLDMTYLVNFILLILRLHCQQWFRRGTDRSCHYLTWPLKPVMGISQFHNLQNYPSVTGFTFDILLWCTKENYKYNKWSWYCKFVYTCSAMLYSVDTFFCCHIWGNVKLFWAYITRCTLSSCTNEANIYMACKVYCNY